MAKERAKDSVEKKKRPKRILSRIFNAILVLVFFALLLLSLLTLGFFAATVNNVNGASTTPGCLLYATAHPSSMDSDLSAGGSSCGFVIWGQAVLVVFSIASMAYLIVKIIAGFSM